MQERFQHSHCQLRQCMKEVFHRAWYASASDSSRSTNLVFSDSSPFTYLPVCRGSPHTIIRVPPTAVSPSTVVGFSPFKDGTRFWRACYHGSAGQEDDHTGNAGTYSKTAWTSIILVCWRDR